MLEQQWEEFMTIGCSMLFLAEMDGKLEQARENLRDRWPHEMVDEVERRFASMEDRRKD